MNNLKNRGLEDILIAVVPSHGLQANHCRVTDGLKGFPDAINAAFPNTTVQTCVRHWARTNGAFNGSLHPVRHSLNFCGWKDRKNVAKSLKRIYSLAWQVMFTSPRRGHG
jgi:putative transposase